MPMARQFDNSFVMFAKPLSPVLNILSTALLAFLIAGLVIAAASQQWLIAAIFGVSIVALVVSSAVGYRQTRRRTRGEKKIEWQAALPEIQRQNLSLEVTELSKILEIESERIGDLQSAYIVAEDLALRQIQREEQVPLMRHVNVGGVPFDAVFIKHDVIVCCEVSFLVASELRQERLDAILRKIGLVKRSIQAMEIGMQVRLMIILVTQLADDDLKRLRSTLGASRFESTPVDIDIRLLDFEALQRIYITD